MVEVQKRKNSRENIVKEAAVLFKEKGYSGTSMRELAQYMGVEAAGLYNHIENKAEILQEICFNVAREFLTHMDEVEQRACSAKEKLSIIVKGHIRVIIQMQNEVAVANSEWKSLDEMQQEEYKRLRKKYEDKIIGIVEEGIEKCEFKKLNASMVMYTLLSSIRWIELWYKEGRGVSESEIQDHVLSMVLEGLSI